MKSTYYIMIIFIFNELFAYQNIDYVNNQLIVKFDTNESVIKNEVYLNNAGFTLKKQLSKTLNIWLFNVKNNEYSNIYMAIDFLEKLHFIIYVQLDHKMEIRDFPTDPQFENMWHHYNIGQSGGIEDADIDSPEAWDITTGGNTNLDHNIVVAVIDGGFQWDHQDLINNAWENHNEIPNNNIDDDGNGLIDDNLMLEDICISSDGDTQGKSEFFKDGRKWQCGEGIDEEDEFIDDINGWDAYDNNGVIPVESHGTKVSGVIGATGNNNLDVVGVNWDVDIMYIAGSSATTSTVIAAYSYALDNKILWIDTDGVLGANVVATNSSFGINYADCNSPPYPVWNDMYNSLGSYGILSVAATMNLNANVDEQGDVPTGCSSDFLISVTNTTRTDEKFGSAAYGLESIDLGAPGTSICTTRPTNQISCSSTGTSYSSPVVAGAIALIHAGASDMLAQEYINYPSETALLIKDIIINTVDPILDLENITGSGGMLNLYNAVYLAYQYNDYCNIPGDLNNDSSVDIHDIMIILNCVLHLDCSDDNFTCMDINSDNEISIYDIISIVNFIIE